MKEWNDGIVFVRRVIPGAANPGYGLHVARLAGLPLSVIDRAKPLHAKLESDDTAAPMPPPRRRACEKVLRHAGRRHRVSFDVRRSGVKEL